MLLFQNGIKDTPSFGNGYFLLTIKDKLRGYKSVADQKRSSVQPAAGRVLKCRTCPKESEEMVSPRGFDLRWEKGNSRLSWTHLTKNLQILLKSLRSSKI